MALGRNLSALTTFAVVCLLGTNATGATAFELRMFEDDCSIAQVFAADVARITLATPTAPARRMDMDRVNAEPVTFGAKAEAVAARPEYFLFTEAGKAIAEWGRERS